MILRVIEVRFGSEADILRCPRHVRFTPESGHLHCSDGYLCGHTSI